MKVSNSITQKEGRLIHSFINIIEAIKVLGVFGRLASVLSLGLDLWDELT